MSQPKRKKGRTNQAQPGEAKTKTGRDFQEQCLRISVVLRTIFKELPASDLLSVRLVNKIWYTEVNSVMMNLDVELKISSEKPFEQIGQLIELIPEMSLPFNGLSFSKVKFQSNDVGIPENARCLVSKFLQVLPPIKHLHFNESTVSADLIAEIMRANAGHLESLSFDNEYRLPFEIRVALHRLKKVKSITPKNSSGLVERVWNVGSILLRLESLESVNDYIFQDLWEVPENCFGVVKHFSLNTSRWHCQQKLLKFVEAKPKLESLSLVSQPLDLSPQMIPILYDLVYCSKETLTSVDCSPCIWELLARGLLHFEPLPRIRELHKVPVNFSRMTSNQIAHFGGFIAYTFPNLKFIEVENVDFDEERAGAIYDVFANPNENYSLANSSVTSLKFVECRPLQVSLSVAILAAFPNVRNLNVSLREGKLQSVYDLWGAGLDLKNLNMSAQVKSRLEMESELLGIFPEEARRLRELKLPPAQLRSLQIVPIMPALHHLSVFVASLAELSIRIPLRRSGILLLQWNSAEVNYAGDCDHNEIIKALSLARMKGLKIAG